MSEPLRTVLWRGIWLPGREWCQLARDGNGWRLNGTVLIGRADEPVMARYEISLDDGWSTREVSVDVWAGLRQQSLTLTVDRGQRWAIQRDPAPDATTPPDNAAALSGLADVDLGFTPATNTLPIRRLAPAIGAGVDATAAWVRFPELTVQPLPQRYTRRDELRYRYESNNGAFVAELEVDDLGLVVRYEGGWERIAEA